MVAMYASSLAVGFSVTHAVSGRPSVSGGVVFVVAAGVLCALLGEFALVAHGVIWLTKRALRSGDAAPRQPQRRRLLIGLGIALLAVGEALIAASAVWLVQSVFRAFTDIATRANSTPAIVAGGGSAALAGITLVAGYLFLFSGEIVLIGTALVSFVRRWRARSGGAAA